MTTDLERFKQLNTTHSLNMRSTSIEPFPNAFRLFDIEYTCHLFIFKEDSSKTPASLHRLGLTNKSKGEPEYAKNNGFDNGNNTEVLEIFRENKEKWFHTLKQNGNLRFVWAHRTGTDVIVIDVDCEEDLQEPFIRRILLKYPCYLSVNRRIFKIILPITDKMPPSLKNAGFKDKIFTHTDVLGKGNWSFVPRDGIMFNTDFTVDRIHESDYNNLPETLHTLDKTKPSRPKPTSDFAPLSLHEFHSMLDFVINASKQEFPNAPEQQVFSEYINSNKKDTFLSFLSLCKSFDPENGFEIVKEYAPKIARFDASKLQNGTMHRDYINCQPISIGFLINLHKRFRKLFPPPPPEPVIPACYETQDNREQITFLLTMIRDGIFNQSIVADFVVLHPIADNYRFCCKEAKWYTVDAFNFWTLVKEQHPSSLQNEICVLMNTYFDEMGDEKDIKRLRNTVGTCSFLNGVCCLLRQKCRYDSFMDVLNTKSNLWAFSNGVVYDIDVCRYRKLCPSDYLSVHCQYEPPTPDPVIQKEVMDYYESCFIQKDKYDFETEEMFQERLKNQQANLDYLLNTKASHLFRGNIQQECYIHTGHGENGKGVDEVLMENCFGGYYIDYSPDILCKESIGNNAHSDLPRGRNARFGHIGELNSETSILPHVYKKLSGFDVITARHISQSQESFMPQFILDLYTNDCPRMKQRDNAAERRTRTIVWPFLFKPQDEIDRCKDPHEKVFYKLKKGTLKQTFKEKGVYAQQLWLLLLDRYIRYVDKIHHFPVPRDFVESNEEYMEDSDPILEFMKDNYDIDEDPNKEKEWKTVRVLLTHYKLSKFGKDRSTSSKRFAANLRTAKYPFKKERINSYENGKQIKDTVVKVVKGGNLKQAWKDAMSDNDDFVPH